MKERFRRFWSAPLWDKFATIVTLLHMVRSAVIYKPFFKSFGSFSVIRNPIMISNPRFIELGDRVSIRDGVRLEVLQSKVSRVPRLSIGDDTNIEQHVHIVCHSNVTIGRSVSITARCCVVDVSHPYQVVDDSVKVGARIADEDSFVEIGDGAFLGVGTVVLPNVRIGKGAVVGANSVVVSDVAPYSVVAGVPAKLVRILEAGSGKWVVAGSEKKE